MFCSIVISVQNKCDHFSFFNRLTGKCLIFAEPKIEEVFANERRSGVEDENPADLIYESKIRIILDNTTSLKYVVGILGNDIPFTNMMDNMFKKNVTAASWLKFERLGKSIRYFKTHSGYFRSTTLPNSK